MCPNCLNDDSCDIVDNDNKYCPNCGNDDLSASGSGICRCEVCGAIFEQKIILDRDLAELYGGPTKRLNEQVKRNIKRFPEKFMFQISESEKEELVTICDRFKILKHSSNIPYAFTEH